MTILGHIYVSVLLLELIFGIVCSIVFKSHFDTDAQKELLSYCIKGLKSGK